MFDNQTKKFCSAVVDALPNDISEDVMQGWIGNPKGLQKFLHGLCPPADAESPLDTTIHIDRSVKPIYPDWVKKVMCPELECAGPTDYDLTKDVELWLHDGQKNGRLMKGQAIYDYLLKTTNTLASYLNLQDGLAIQQKGIVVFRKLFGGKAVFLWGSVVRDRDGGLVVPYLYAGGVKVVLDWRWLRSGWVGSNPAARLASSTRTLVS